MITRVQSGSPDFKAARINILATADNHGNIMQLPRVLKTIENNAKEIFPKAESPSTFNFLTIGGDWFNNPSKKGLLTHPELSNGDMQNLAMLKTIDSVKVLLKKLAAKTSGIISGKTAEIVAEKFAEISKNIQVIAISHLPQIISFADTSFKISKRSIPNNCFAFL